jgi:LysR family transcriptional regulator, positive regulator for ilvC
MDQYSIKLFLHLTETLHFGKTSQACNLSPSALSRQIQRMEDEVGQRLFDRDNRKVEITRAGQLFKEYAKTVQEKWQSLMDEMVGEERTLKGEISLYCSVTASLSILPELLNAFRNAYPKVHIRLQTGDAGMAIQKVIEGESDIAVSALPDRLPKELMFKILTETALVFVGPKIQWEFSRALKKEIPWEKIPMILSEHGLARKRIDTWFKKRGIQPNIYAQVAGNEAILSMVSLGCGIGVVPKLVFESSPLQKNISILDIKPELAPYAVGICIQKRRIKSRIVRAFWEIGS